MQSKILFFMILMGPLLSLGGANSTLKKDSELKEKPFSDSKTIKILPLKEKVEVLELTGGWAKVKGPQVVGYIKIFNLQTQPLKANSSINSEIGKSGSKSAVASTGVKGVSEEDLKNLKPAPELASALDKFEPKPEELVEFRKQRKASLERSKK